MELIGKIILHLMEQFGVWAIGGVTKGRIYGAPVMSKSMVSTSVHHNPIR